MVLIAHPFVLLPDQWFEDTTIDPFQLRNHWVNQKVVVSVAIHRHVSINCDPKGSTIPVAESHYIFRFACPDKTKMNNK